MCSHGRHNWSPRALLRTGCGAAEGEHPCPDGAMMATSAGPADWITTSSCSLLLSPAVDRTLSRTHATPDLGQHSSLYAS